MAIIIALFCSRFATILTVVKGKHYIHILLLLALCTGQVAANVHFIGHLHSSSSQINHEHHHSTEHLAEHLAEHLRDHLSSEERPELVSQTGDCAIYHAYIGLYGMASVYCDDIVTQFTGTIHLSPCSLTIVAQSKKTPVIRGPPSHS